ncbi:MAG TPA: C40 family peptidase [Chitinophagaceae bacterium]|nr:C40 family peptidase [Chitinophagaceae bacterium]
MSSPATLAICTVPVLPMREGPSQGSEMVSELIFGECYEIVRTQAGNWHRVRSGEDGYEGWSLVRHPAWVEESLFHTTGEPLAGDWVNEVELDGQSFMVPLGSRLKGLGEEGARWGNIHLTYHGRQIPAADQAPDQDRIRAIATQFLNSSYLWGGKTVFGLDCSGFTQSVYRLIGTRISRDASQQYGEGEQLPASQQPCCGDLAFFNQGSGKPTHVGIILEPGRIIHCSEKVRVDALDSMGIRLSETGELTHRLVGICRYFRLREC